jgi:hypothetical protein
LEFDEMAPVIRILMTKYLPSFKKMHPKLVGKVLEDFFAWMDINKSNNISMREFKSAMLAAWFNKMPQRILETRVEKSEELFI